MPGHNQRFSRFELWEHGLMVFSTTDVIVWLMDCLVVAKYGDNLPCVTIEYSNHPELRIDGDSLAIVIPSRFIAPT